MMSNSRHHKITGLPSAPKEIPGLLKRDARSLVMLGGGKALHLHRAPTVGEAITVYTDLGSIRVRVEKVSEPDGAMIGTVEILNTPGGADLDSYGIKYGDSVIVHSMDFVHIVHIGPLRT